MSNESSTGFFPGLILGVVVGAVVALLYAPQDLVRTLQGAGILAAIVIDASDMASDPHLSSRGFFIDMEHPVLGKIRSDCNPVRLSATPSHYEKAAPMLGEDNRHVFIELLGMDEERFKSPVNDNIIDQRVRRYTTFPASIVISTFVSANSSGFTLPESIFNMTRSAYLPRAIVPNCLSWKHEYAALIV